MSKKTKMIIDLLMMKVVDAFLLFAIQNTHQIHSSIQTLMTMNPTDN